MSGVAGSEPAPFRRGQPLRAADLNAMLEVLRAADVAGVGPGLAVSRGAGGVVVSLAAAFAERAVAAVVTGVTVDGQPYAGPGPEPQGLVRYAVRLLESGAEAQGLAPINRVFGDAGVRVFPAAVDDPCVVLRMPSAGDQARLFLLTLSERVAAVVCGSGGGA